MKLQYYFHYIHFVTDANVVLWRQLGDCFSKLCSISYIQIEGWYLSLASVVIEMFLLIVAVNFCEPHHISPIFYLFTFIILANLQ